MQSTDPGGPTGHHMSSDQKPSSAPSWESTKSWMIRWRGSRQLVLVIVAIALLLDNMLLTVVGEYMYKPKVPTNSLTSLDDEFEDICELMIIINVQK